MEPLEPLDQLLRGPAAVGPAERARRWATPPRLAGAAVVTAVVGALALITAAAPPPVEMSLPQASASDGAVSRTTPADEPGDPGAAGEAVGSPAASTTTVVPVLVVHVAGAVATPGLVELPAAARIADALAAAGGPVAGADVDRLNLAAPAVDGGRVYVPLVGQAEPVVAAGAPSASADTAAAGSASQLGPVDLNSATAEQLDVLPGVGPATAAAIVAHRDENGPFLGVDELQDVRGIGPAKFEALRDLVVAGG